jgi:hypothetical protein
MPNPEVPARSALEPEVCDRDPRRRPEDERTDPMKPTRLIRAPKEANACAIPESA